MPQDAYGNYNCPGMGSADMLYVPTTVQCLQALGWTSASAVFFFFHLSYCLPTALVRSLTCWAGEVQAGYAVAGDAGEGAYSHMCIGVDTDTIDCHNNARYHVHATSFLLLLDSYPDLRHLTRL